MFDQKRYIFICLLALSSMLYSCTGKQDKKTSGEKGTSSVTETPNSSVDAASGMIAFEGGTFMMGSNQGTEMEKPAHEVTVKSFRMDKSPVTVAQFRKFIEATGYKTDADKFGDSGVFDQKTSAWALVKGANWQYPFGKGNSAAPDNHPVTHVSWNDASAFASWVGKRLPTEAEWEYAATCSGKNRYKYSWGDKLVVGGKFLANVWQGNSLDSKQGEDGYIHTSPVGVFGQTGCGMTDMGGNVWNWCADVFKPYPGNAVPFQLNNDSRVIRGGSFFFDEKEEQSYTVTFRANNTIETSLFNTGFRCAANN